MPPPNLDAKLRSVCPELAELIEETSDGIYQYVGPDNLRPIAARMLELAEACEYALSYLPAKDGKRTGEPDGDVQLMICNKLKAALGLTPASAEGGQAP